MLLLSAKMGPIESDLAEEPMRKLVYSVAMSLDGYIAGSKGESDWIVIDPEIDFNAIFARFDTILLAGKRTRPPAPKAAAGRLV